MRLIDADALPSDVMLPANEDDEEFEFVSIYDIEHAPTVDAVPVVRCKDCKHFKPISENVGRCRIHYEKSHGQRMVMTYKYCAWAERRDDETD